MNGRIRPNVQAFGSIGSQNANDDDPVAPGAEGDYLIAEVGDVAEDDRVRAATVDA